jgi:PAS domain S-box-containing protein
VQKSIQGQQAITAEHWRQIVNSATDTAIISTDQNGVVTSWSAGASLLLGWSEEEMLGQSLFRIFPQENAGQFEKERQDALSLGRGGEEGWRLKKDGNQLWAAGELAPTRNDSGEVVGFVKILRDRTAQRLVEEEIRSERHALELLNRTISALSVEVDVQKIVQLVTDAGVELSGAEFGAFFYNVLNESGEAYMLYTLSGAPLEAFSKFPMPRNTKVFAPTFEGEGIMRSDDITQDPRYGHTAPHYGMPKGHLPVKSYLAVPVISRSGEVLGGLFFGHARPAVFTDRSERGLTALAAEAAVAIDNVRLSQAAQREIAERKRAEDALKELNANLEAQVLERSEQLKVKEEALRQSQKMESIGQLTGGVAHDFNNLLQVIIGNLHTLQRGLPQDAGRLLRAAGNAMNGAQRAASLTKRLLAFARRQPLDPKPTDVNSLVVGMSDLLHRALGEEIRVETVTGAGLWRVEVDPAELESAILNLALNARDAMPDGGKLTIETANTFIDEAYAAIHTEVIPGQYVAVCVTDTGSGMPPEVAAQAFEPFFTTKPVGQGTGLGLSQIYGFTKQSGGHVKIYSELGQGTTLKMYLPRMTAPVEVHAETVPELPLPEGSTSETILVLEDDDDVRAHSVEVLRELGYRVLEAPDGPSALRLMEVHGRVDLLFSDVVLPGGLTGAQVAAQAKHLQPDIKVLFTTGYARNAIIHNGRLDKGVQLITKPFSHADLAEKVRSALDDR